VQVHLRQRRQLLWKRETVQCQGETSREDTTQLHDILIYCMITKETYIYIYIYMVKWCSEHPWSVFLIKSLLLIKFQRNHVSPKSSRRNANTCKRTSEISWATRLLPWSFIPLKPDRDLLIFNQPTPQHIYPNTRILTPAPLLPAVRVSRTNAPPSWNPACRRAVMDVHITAAVYKASVNKVQPPRDPVSWAPAPRPSTPHTEGLHASNGS